MTSYLGNIITHDIIEIGEEDVMHRGAGTGTGTGTKRNGVLPKRSTNIICAPQRQAIAAFPGCRPNPPT